MNMLACCHVDSEDLPGGLHLQSLSVQACLLRTLDSRLDSVKQDAEQHAVPCSHQQYAASHLQVSPSAAVLPAVLLLW